MNKKKLFKGQWEAPPKPIEGSKNDIGKRLNLFRKSRFMTLAKFGKVVFVSPGSLSDLENGNSLPSASTLKNFYYAGCDINWLLTGEE